MPLGLFACLSLSFACAFFLVLFAFSASVGGALVALVAFAGSRSLPSSARSLVASVVGAVLASGRRVGVGCAVGADAFALAAALAVSPAAVSVFAVGGPRGLGFSSGSALALVRRAFASGALVAWRAGGPLSVPLRARLALRSRACVAVAAASGAGAGLVAFVSAPPPSSVGSWRSVLSWHGFAS